MAISAVYCTATDIKDVYPNVDEYDTKTPIYGWEATQVDTATHYQAFNVGNVENLFIDGMNMVATKHTVTLAATDVDGSFNSTTTTMTVTNGAKIADNIYIKVDNEIMKVTAKSTNNLTISRGELGTEPATHLDEADIYLLFTPGNDADPNSWYYDSTNDFILLNHAVDPANLNVEAGPDWSTLTTRIIKNASRYFDSRVDASLPRDQWRDKEGNFDYMVIRTTALIAAYFLVNAREPGSELALRFMEEANFNIEQVNSGKSKLSNQVSSDASNGIVREVLSPQNANGIHIVDTRGRYTGSYDLMKIIVTTGGVLGTAKFSVFKKDTSNLKISEVLKDEIINGQYQSIGDGLQIRFQGKDSASEATANDEWELEAWGVLEAFDGSPGSAGNTRITRRDVSSTFGRQYRKL